MKKFKLMLLSLSRMSESSESIDTNTGKTETNSKKKLHIWTYIVNILLVYHWVRALQFSICFRFRLFFSFSFVRYDCTRSWKMLFIIFLLYLYLHRPCSFVCCIGICVDKWITWMKRENQVVIGRLTVLLSMSIIR